MGKNVKTVGAKYEHALHRVWNVMLDLQPVGTGLYNQPLYQNQNYGYSSQTGFGFNHRPSDEELVVQPHTQGLRDEDYFVAGEQFTSGFARPRTEIQRPSKRARKAARRAALVQPCTCGHVRNSHRVVNGENTGHCLMCKCDYFEFDGNATPRADLTVSASLVDSGIQPPESEPIRGQEEETGTD